MEGNFPFLHSAANAKYVQAKKIMEVTAPKDGKDPITMGKPYVNDLSKSTAGFKDRAEVDVSRWSDLAQQAKKLTPLI